MNKNMDETSRWKNTGYNAYRLVLWSCMLNDMSLAFGSSEIAHSMFYIHAAIYITSVIFIGIPLVYSEICIAQYSNNSIISIWDYFPLFRSFGYGSVVLLLYKTLYTLTLAAWYLQYTFYAAIDPPPWYTCADFQECRCMVKRINKSIFQHCIEAQVVYQDDCGVKTASNCFFEREIGDENTRQSLSCMVPWKSVVSAVSLLLSVYLLTIKKDRFLILGVKISLLYLGVVILAFCCTAFSTSNGWIAPGSADNSNLDYLQLCRTTSHAFMSLGTGTGIIIFLSCDVPFRSPAIMTAIVTSLLSTFVSILFALIAFSAIMIMSYFHGEEDKVIEIGNSIFFEQLASISEILSYIEPGTIWGFCWFSAMFICLFLNFWILIIVLSELLNRNVKFSRKYFNLTRFFLVLIILLMSCPFFCSDLTASIADAAEVGQLVSSFAVSASIYWFYGYKKHSVDIIFMLGVKSSYFWKICWVLNPLLLILLICAKVSSLYVWDKFDEEPTSHTDEFTFYGLMGFYGFVVFGGMVIDIFNYATTGHFLKLFVPTDTWGPQDKVLYKSRVMFMPEIMTREFLYRQVRLYGYDKTPLPDYLTKERDVNEITSHESCQIEWSALTSN